ncbi:MAG: xanthine dehydrogenase family protein molybdopterin-binding subunit [Candidatus Rokubacteria bacterium]|nr:xanthine dehydrogenase family protein molybdopterin-binding subunit [Candidatus Rokubacteria bacterium]
MSFLVSRAGTARDGIGQPILRTEDARLLVGGGSYSDDVNLAGQAYACFVRSPHAHARIGRIDVAAARATPGVIAVLTGVDAEADGVKPIPHAPVPLNPYEQMIQDADVRFIAPHPPMPADRVRFVGAIVAAVIAETPAAARDGAERVAVEWTPLPAVPASLAAVAGGAPSVWDECPSNLCVDTEVGDRAATDLAFSRAAHVVRLETQVQRIAGVPMEPRAAVAAWDASSGRYTVHAGAGGLGRTQAGVAGALGVPVGAVRVTARDVGGNFGTRNSCYAEPVLVAWAARRLGRPVKWTAERREAFVADYQGRDLASHAELALDAEGRVLALRGVNTSNVGAHAVHYGPLNKGLAIATTVYRVPVVSLRGRSVVTNTPPTTPYRSSGRPEVTFVMERLIDLAARRHGFDRLELRRQNLVPATAMPHRNAMGVRYDSGDYLAAMDRAVALADWTGFPARRSEARRRGRYRGIGVANYIELNTGYPRERAHVTVRPDGYVDVVLGTLSSGQGHATSFPQLLVEWLGVPHSTVRLITGDTDVTIVGGGAHSARALRLASIVMAKASDQIVEKATRIAAWMMEAAAADVEFAAPRFRVKGTDRTVDLFETARAALRPDAPDDLRGPLDGTCDETLPQPSFPYGCAVCEVEVDPDTGVVEIVRYTTVDDCGRAVNPMILHGQTHGGIAQGVGQALWESCVYDPDTAQLLSSTLMDYALPRADALPSFTTELSEVPSTAHPLGLRGGGEGGTTPALGAVVNAICDALAELGVEHVELPATPERVWQAIRDAVSPRDRRIVKRATRGG